MEAELISAYNQGRRTGRTDLVCLAPSSNMYFNMYGQAAPCWLTLEFAPQYPYRSIRDLWFGEEFEGFRKRIAGNDLSGPCNVCQRNIRNRVFTSTLARAYDHDYPASVYPTIMEFELSNTCNLECIMCKGTLSSTIRRDRDHLPPMKAPYDDAFVDQLEEFIPHLKEARFNGGEPLLQKICWDIWERMRKLNPAIEITVATNGTTLGDRARRMLEAGRFRVNLSLDSLEKETYESIRVNASLESTLANTEWFGEYCRRKGTNFCIMVNPMRNNWREMPSFVRFCAEKRYYLWFNTIWRPPHLALWNLPSAELEAMRSELGRELAALEKPS
ncbi:MAG TPA: radical SAM protein [Bdellovibrionota bacterium]|nr:radical SAM protein [Bdellovibrionota bacterium]